MSAGNEYCEYCKDRHGSMYRCKAFEDALNPPPKQVVEEAIMPNELKSCEHRRTRQMIWPDNGSAEVCTDCLLTRHHWEQGETEWQDHGYKTVADWYAEAEELERSMDGSATRPNQEDLAEAVELLKRLEYPCMGCDDITRHCLICGVTEKKGHRDNCPVKSFLKRQGGS